MTPDQLRSIRASLGLSQSQMAGEMRVTVNHYKKLESGKCTIVPSTERLIQLIIQNWKAPPARS